MMSSTVNPDVTSAIPLDDDPVKPNPSSHGEDEADLSSTPEEEEEDDSSNPEEEEEDESDGYSGLPNIVKRFGLDYKPPPPPPPRPDGTVVPKHLRTKLSFFAGSNVSIESIELKIKAGAGDSPIHEIYSKIMVSGRRGKVYAVYHREENKPDRITEDRPYPLKLCGPKYSLSSNTTEFLHIRLFEKGLDKPFIKGDLLFQYVGHRWGVHHELIQMHLDGDWGDLIVSFTRLCYSMPARIRLYPTTEDPHAQWTVSGTVKATQCRALLHGDGSFERTLTLFEGKGVQVSSGDVIPLDRSVVVSPIHTEGRPGSLTIHIDLQFVENDTARQLKGNRRFVFEEDNVSGELFSGNIIPKRAHTSSTSTSGGRDNIEVVVTHFHDFNCDLSEEEDMDDYFDLLATLFE